MHAEALECYLWPGASKVSDNALDCAFCHHVPLLTPEALLKPGLSPAAKVLDLKRAVAG
jgi:hypothetical protein